MLSASELSRIKNLYERREYINNSLSKLDQLLNLQIKQSKPELSRLHLLKAKKYFEGKRTANNHFIETTEQMVFRFGD